MVTTEKYYAEQYASEIQKGLLPKARHFEKMGLDYGLFWEPANILSGDFYWLGYKNGYHYIAIADCTGHGISASLLSVMGISLLNYIILGKDYCDLGEYLKELDKKWIETFQSERESDLFNNDWMEIILVKLDLNKKLLEICGARLVAILKKYNGELIFTKTNRYPIGGWQIEKNRDYISDQILFDKNDELYLLTDGIIDQFGGEKNKKFGWKNLLNLINLNFDSMQDKIQYIREVISLWKGQMESVDDITLLGLKF